MTTGVLLIMLIAGNDSGSFRFRECRSDTFYCCSLPGQGCRFEGYHAIQSSWVRSVLKGPSALDPKPPASKHTTIRPSNAVVKPFQNERTSVCFSLESMRGPKGMSKTDLKSLALYVCTYVCTHACMHVCMYVCVHVCMYVCMYVCYKYERMYVCVHRCMHACMHAYIQY